jgi:hypothetical protein
MENVGIFYDHMEYFTAICYNLRSFGIGSLWSFGMFPILVCLDQEKSGNPGWQTTSFQQKFFFQKQSISL